MNFINKGKSLLIISVIIILLAVVITASLLMKTPTNPTWKFQSIDTMKASRDLAREKKDDPEFAKQIDEQVAKIADTGATHVAIGTPYDEEFLPILTMWVDTARKHNLKIWFRGNWSGWEQWFEYPQITHEEHIAKTEQFILNNPDLFEDGDVFSSCPECENGPEFQYGNPAELAAYRKFLIKQYETSKHAFAKINKNVDSNYFSMNADVAKAVMDKPTTQALDNRVVIDHYVASTEQLATDVQQIAKQTGATIVLGEIGAPIPDLHGQMTEEEQKAWMKDAFTKLSVIEELEGLNYWTHMGGTTALWNQDGSPKPLVEEITKTFKGRS